MNPGRSALGYCRASPGIDLVISIRHPEEGTLYLMKTAQRWSIGRGWTTTDLAKLFHTYTAESDYRHSLFIQCSIAVFIVTYFIFRYWGCNHMTCFQSFNCNAIYWSGSSSWPDLRNSKNTNFFFTFFLLKIYFSKMTCYVI